FIGPTACYQVRRKRSWTSAHVHRQVSATLCLRAASRLPTRRLLCRDRRTGQKFAHVYFRMSREGARTFPWRRTIMHATNTPLLVSLLVSPLLTQTAQSAPH